MKEGDLVELSSQGRKIAGNWSVKDLVGIVLKVSEYENPYRVKWMDFADPRSQKTWHMKRYEIKKVRKKHENR